MEKNINKKAFPVRSMSEVQFKLWDCKSDCEKLKEKSSNLTVKRKDMQVKLDFGNYHNPIADIFPTLDSCVARFFCISWDRPVKTDLRRALDSLF